MRLYSMLRGVAFTALYFFALPGLLILVNEQLGWPRWQSAALDALGTLFIVSGLGVCVHCGWLFWSLGRGTPVPSQPPGRLVESGLYRFSRHPMYVAYVSIGLGVFLVEGHLALALYPVVLFLLAEAYLRKIEEPRLIGRFGTEYEAYCRRVPRWPRPGF